MGKDLELEDSESDDSEYFSAEENFPNKMENVDECADEDGSSSDVAISDKEGVHTAFQAVSICDSGGERKRWLSKKQKKKRRRQRKEGNERLFMCYAEYTAPFRFAESIDYSIDELREDLVSETSNSPAHVPSLFELCTKSLWSNTKSKQLRYQLLPVPLKTAVSLHRQLQAFATFQLSCLYRSLAELESKDTALDTGGYTQCVVNRLCCKRSWEGYTEMYDIISVHAKRGWKWDHQSDTFHICVLWTCRLCSTGWFTWWSSHLNVCNLT